MCNKELHLVSDARIEQLPLLIEQLIDSGITTVQLRHKSCDKGVLYQVGMKIKRCLAGSNIHFIINDHIDLAMALDADGVHIGQTDLPWTVARRLLGDKKIIGLSIQSFQDLEKALSADVNYFGVGPIFQTQTKKGVHEIGLNTLSTIISATKTPCIAIGGIQLAHVSELVAIGVSGIAVVSGIFQAKNPKQAALSYHHALSQ